MFLILRTSLRLAYTLAEGALRVSRWKKKLNRRFNRNDRKKEGAEPMKKSCLIAVIAALAAVAGALAAVAVYLRRREQELDEYERLLYSDDGDDYDDDDEYLPIDNEPTEAAEEKAADDAE